jgi:hypothetical protein
MSVVIVACCQVEISALGWSLVQRSPTECSVSNECDNEALLGVEVPRGEARWKKKDL